MPFPNVDPLVESFFEPTRIFLFGKPFPSLAYAPATMAAGRKGKGLREFEDYRPSPPVRGETKPAELPMPPTQIEQTLRQMADDGIFARIYGFSFEGHYYKMPRPLLFLVRGEGERYRPAEEVKDGARRFNTRFVGVEAKDWQFSDDILVWGVDKRDLAICLDIEVGSYDEVLLDSMVAFQEDASSRSAVNGRSAAASRSAVTSRSAASFRSAVIGPHQDR